MAYRVRLDDVVTFPWLLTVTAPVPLAAEFQPLNTYLSRVKTFALTAVDVFWGTICWVMEPVPPFESNVIKTGAVVIKLDALEALEVPCGFVAVIVKV